MSDELLFLLTLLSALGTGLVAGVFYAFSTFVMRALGRLPPAQGIAAMQAINVAVINPWFLIVFLGTAATCAVVAFQGMLISDERAGLFMLGGSALYLIGTFLLTMAANVPLNNWLAKIEPAGADSAERWSRYVRYWTLSNHVRTLAAFLAMLLLMLGLY
jgi:uncharacterized membrane protein